MKFSIFPKENNLGEFLYCGILGPVGPVRLGLALAI